MVLRSVAGKIQAPVIAPRERDEGEEELRAHGTKAGDDEENPAGN